MTRDALVLMPFVPSWLFHRDDEFFVPFVPSWLSRSGLA
jgi:hypothetical protein